VSPETEGYLPSAAVDFIALGRGRPWITVYQLNPGGKTREHTCRGYAATDPDAIKKLQDLLIEATKTGTAALLPGGREDLSSSTTSARPFSARPTRSWTACRSLQQNNLASLEANDLTSGHDPQQHHERL